MRWIVRNGAEVTHRDVKPESLSASQSQKALARMG
jgi:hypothetical protein